MKQLIAFGALIALYAGEIISWKIFIVLFLLGLTWIVLKEIEALESLIKRDPFTEYGKIEAIEDNIEEINNELTEIKRLIKNNISINCDLDDKLKLLIKDSCD